MSPRVDGSLTSTEGSLVFGDKIVDGITSTDEIRSLSSGFHNTRGIVTQREDNGQKG